jgi:hypothetical protein
MTALSAAALSVMAQPIVEEESESVVVFGKTSDADRAIFEKDRPQGVHEIPTPKFTVKTSDNKFMLTIGGAINVIMGCDLGNNLYKMDGAGINFITNEIPVPAVKGRKADYYINALNSKIDLQIVGFGGTANQITGYFRIGTDGISPQIKFKRAYLSWRNFTGGLKKTLLEDANACQPPTIDPQGPSGCVSTTVYEVGYTSPSFSGFRFAAALDMPTWYSSNGVYRGKDYPTFDGTQVADYGDAEQVVPDIPIWIQYEFSKWNRIRVSGIIRNFAYRDLVKCRTRHTVGWGVMLSGNIQPLTPVILYYQLAYGCGIGNYLQDIAGMPLSFIPKSEVPGEMKASPMAGFNIGATFNISPKWQINIMGSESRIWDVSRYCTASDATANYKYALYGAANVFYNISSYLQWGIEYIYGRHQTWNKSGANDSRIQTQMQFTF